MVGLWRYRRFVWDAALSDLRYRYAGSGLGVFWNVLTPLAMLALYTIIFAGMLAPRVSIGGRGAEAFVLYLGSGFLPWGGFVDGVVRGTQSLVGNAAYLKKMPIPEQVFVAQSAVTATLGMLISFVLLVGLALLLNQPPRLTWLLLPLVAVVWQTFGFGLALALGTLNVFFRDIAQLLGVAFQIWMWSLPVIYVEDILPLEYRQIVAFNPAYPFVRAIRDAFLTGQVPDMSVWLAMLGWSVLALAVGLAILTRLRTEVRDLL
jgi:lipopolysaccharide transport system permease protein